LDLFDVHSAGSQLAAYQREREKEESKVYKYTTHNMPNKQHHSPKTTHVLQTLTRGALKTFCPIYFIILFAIYVTQLCFSSKLDILVLSINVIL